MEITKYLMIEANGMKFFSQLPSDSFIQLVRDMGIDGRISLLEVYSGFSQEIRHPIILLEERDPTSEDQKFHDLYLSRSDYYRLFLNYPPPTYRTFPDVPKEI